MWVVNGRRNLAVLRTDESHFHQQFVGCVFEIALVERLACKKPPRLPNWLKHGLGGRRVNLRPGTALQDEHMPFFRATQRTEILNLRKMRGRFSGPHVTQNLAIAVGQRNVEPGKGPKTRLPRRALLWGCRPATRARLHRGGR